MGAIPPALRVRTEQCLAAGAQAVNDAALQVDPVSQTRPAGRLAYLSLEVLLPGRAAYTHVTEMIAGLERRGWHVSPFLAQPTGSAASRSPVRRIPEHWRVLAKALWQLRRHDVLYIRSHPFAWPAALAARRAGLIVVHEINGLIRDLKVTYPILHPVHSQIVALQMAQHRAANALFAVTPGLVAQLQETLPGQSVHLVPNGANLALFTPDGPRYRHERPYVLFVGSLVRWHGIDTMLSALAHPAWPAGLDLLIAGEGMEGSTLAEAEKRLPNLVWLRRQEYEALPALLRGAVAALVPIGNPDGRSSRGVFPLKLFEAMACGTPVVVTDLPGQAELVRDSGCGVVVPVDDAGRLAAAVAQLMADLAESHVMGDRGALEAHRAHGWQHRADQVHAVLNGLMARAPK